jgi:excisionase family DNA binding protein
VPIPQHDADPSSAQPDPARAASISALLSTEEVAAWLQVPAKTVHQWRYRGTGPRGAKVGRHVRYRRSEVERWLAAREDKSEVAR